jgi:threonine dehydratase
MVRSPSSSQTAQDRPGLAAIREAAGRIAGHVSNTPLIEAALPGCAGTVHLKLETRQPTASFKLRGATNAVRALPEESRALGLVTASTGNHGLALAHAARAAGTRATICMSRLVPENKVAAVRALGAEIRICGASQDEAQEEVARLVARDGLTEIPPFDHSAVIAGQGTIGLEIAAAVPALRLVLVPLSGGGLAAGVAAAIKALLPAVRMVGVSMARGAAMQASLAAGHPVCVTEEKSLADSLGGGIGLANRYTFAMCRDLLDEIVLLSEAEIAAGIAWLGRTQGEVVEGAGAVGVAALLAGKVRAEEPVVTILSGGNIDPALHARIMNGDIA